MALSQGEPTDDWICGFVPCRSGGVPRIQRKRKRPIYAMPPAQKADMAVYSFLFGKKTSKEPSYGVGGPDSSVLG